jgi:uncharacterized membrane protein
VLNVVDFSIWRCHLAGYTVTQIATQMGADSINNEPAPVVAGVAYDTAAGTAKGMIFKGGTVSMPAPLSANGYCHALNNGETVVGRFGRDRWSGKAFSFDIGTGVVLDLQAQLGGAANGEARAINNKGIVVGGLWDGVTQNAFAYDLKTKKLTIIPIPAGYKGCIATSINDNNQVVGLAWLSTDLYAGHQAFVYDLGTGTTTVLPGPGEISPCGINNGGAIVGALSTAESPVICKPPSYAPVVIGPNATAVPVTSDGFGCAYGINTAGDVVGCVGLGDMRGFVYSSSTGAYVDLNSFFPATWHIIIATAINDAGYIAANAYQLPSNVYKSVLLTPA